MTFLCGPFLIAFLVNLVKLVDDLVLVVDVICLAEIPWLWYICLFMVIILANFLSHPWNRQSIILFEVKLLHTEFCHFVMEKPAWSNESNSLFCSAPSVTKKPTGRLAQSGYHNAPPLVTKKLMDRISKKNLLSKICMVQYVQYLFLKAWMTQIPMNNYLS